MIVITPRLNDSKNNQDALAYDKESITIDEAQSESTFGHNATERGTVMTSQSDRALMSSSAMGAGGGRDPTRY